MRILLTVLLISLTLFANGADKQPKLVVGIVVDQMRYDFLIRYWDKFGDKGFKKLVDKGFIFTNTHYNYFPTYTGPGHAAIYTGTTPGINGITGNNWFVRDLLKNTYVTEDPTVKGVGTTGATGAMSPANLLSTTITDELKAYSQGSKIIGIALKDRGAILPAGHRANYAFWLDGATGDWVTSNFYTDSLPGWVKTFNQKKLAAEMIKTPWYTLYPIGEYTASQKDDSPYERPYAKGEKCVFPYDLTKYAKGGFDIIRRSPYGNTLTAEFAKSAILSENMGKDEITDFLAISFSSPDYVGHQFGPHAIETQDVYLRLDRDLADLIDFIEKHAGKNNVLFFLTADHGVADIPALARERKIPAGEFKGKEAIEGLKATLNKRFGNGEWISMYLNDQITFDQKLITSKNVSLDEIVKASATYLESLEGVAKVIAASDLKANKYAEGIYSNYQIGFFAPRCGDLFLVMKPGWFEEEEGPYATTHGSIYDYDTHVPLIFYGWNVKAGKSNTEAWITDIAPTVSSMLNINFPSGCIGKPLIMK